MESLTSAISVQVDTKDKEIANEILKNLGLNMSTFVNMAIKQLLYTNGLPFEVKSPISNSQIDNTSDKSKNDNQDLYTKLPSLTDFINSK